MKKMNFWQKPEGVVLHDGNFDRKKVAYILASLCEGELFSYLFKVLRKKCSIWNKWEKIQENFFNTLFAQRNPERKKYRRHFWPKT